MRLPIALLALAVAAPAALHAAEWKEVTRLTQDIAIALDEDSVKRVMDGADEVVLATFRRDQPTSMMESDIAMNCKKRTARLRAVRLIQGDEVYNQQVSQTTDYHAVNYGSADAIYFKALCGMDIPVPPEALAPPEEEAASAEEPTE